MQETRRVLDGTWRWLTVSILCLRCLAQRRRATARSEESFNSLFEMLEQLWLEDADVHGVIVSILCLRCTNLFSSWALLRYFFCFNSLFEMQVQIRPDDKIRELRVSILCLRCFVKATADDVKECIVSILCLRCAGDSLPWQGGR